MIEEQVDRLRQIVLDEARAAELTATEEERLRVLAGMRARLDELARVLEREGLTTAGSKGQTRPHPLLAKERALGRAYSEGLHQFVWRVENRAEIARLNALTRQAV